MKISNIINLSLKNILRNKRYIFYMLLNIICLSIFIITLTISLTYNNKVKRSMANNPLLNMISIDFGYEEIVHNKEFTEEEKKEIIESILNINHVTDVIFQGHFNGGGNVDERDTDYPEYVRTISLQPLANGMTLPNQSYTKPLKLNEIIIPEEFSYQQYDNSNIDDIKENFIDGKTLIGKTIPIFYEIYDCKNDKFVDRVYLNLKVVGTYDSKATGLSRFTSFSNVETIKQEDNVINMTEECRLSDIYIIQIDETKNINYVKRRIKKLGYSTDEGMFTITPELYSKYVYLMRTIAITSLLFLLVFRFVFCKKILNDNANNIFIFKIFGYNHRDIIKQESLKGIIIDILSMILVAIICYFIVNYYETNYSSLVMDGFIVVNPYLTIIISLAFLIIINYVFNFILLRKRSLKIG